MKISGYSPRQKKSLRNDYPVSTMSGYTLISLLVYSLLSAMLLLIAQHLLVSIFMQQKDVDLLTQYYAQTITLQHSVIPLLEHMGFMPCGEFSDWPDIVKAIPRLHDQQLQLRIFAQGSYIDIQWFQRMSEKPIEVLGVNIIIDMPSEIHIGDQLIITDCKQMQICRVQAVAEKIVRCDHRLIFHRHEQLLIGQLMHFRLIHDKSRNALLLENRLRGHREVILNHVSAMALQSTKSHNDTQTKHYLVTFELSPAYHIKHTHLHTQTFIVQLHQASPI